MLFNILINDFEKGIGRKKMFIKLADDTKLGESRRSPADEFEVQKNLDRIEY